MTQSIFLPVYFDDRHNPTNFGVVGDIAFPTFEEAKEKVITQLSAELQSATINQRHLTAEEIHSRMREARESIVSPGDDYLSDYACSIFGVREVGVLLEPATTHSDSQRGGNPKTIGTCVDKLPTPQRFTAWQAFHFYE